MENTSAQKDLHLFLCASFPLFIQAKLVCVCVCVCEFSTHREIPIRALMSILKERRQFPRSLQGLSVLLDNIPGFNFLAFSGLVLPEQSWMLFISQPTYM